MMSPYDLTCPVCSAPPGRTCTAPTDTGRRTVTWYHLKREDDAREQNAREADLDKRVYG